MAQLTGNAINSSYLGLLKTTDNAALSATSKVLTDGAGNALTLSASTVGMEFTGNIDFTGATVTGIGGGGAAGLISGGTGANSMKNAADLVTIAPITLGVSDLAIGNNSSITYTSPTNDYYTGENIVIGESNTLNKTVDYNFLTRSGSAVVLGARNTGIMGGGANSVAIGYDQVMTSINSLVSIGDNNNSGDKCITIGSGLTASVGQGIQIGANVETMTTGYGNLAIGGGSRARGGGFGQGTCAVGNYAKADGGQSIALGASAEALNAGSIAIGQDATVPAGTTTAIVIGHNSNISTANQRVVLIGNNTSVGSNPANDSVIIGNSTSRTADISNSVQIGLLANLGASNTVAIGRQASSTAGGGCAVGRNSLASGSNSFAGTNSTAAQNDSAAFNGVTSTTASTTAVANLEVIGNGNSIKLTSPNGTVYSITVSDAGALVVA